MKEGEQDCRIERKLARKFFHQKFKLERVAENREECIVVGLGVGLKGSVFFGLAKQGLKENVRW